MSGLFPAKLIPPLLLLLAGLLLRQQASGLHAAYLQLLQLAPYGMLGIVCALGVYYNRARLFIATATLVLVYYLIQVHLQTSLARPQTLLLFSLLSVLHPLGLLVLLLMPERGLRNRYGMLQVSAMLVTVLLASALLYFSPGVLHTWVLAYLPLKVLSGLVLSLPASACYLLVMLLAWYRMIRINDESAFMLLLIALFTFITLAKFELANVSAVLFIAVSLALFIGLLGSSWDMAYRDELTALLGRRALNDRLKGLGRQYVIAMMDIDHFKKFNDTHGHDTGDEVLKMVARHIGAVRGGATAYRYGGEEFCVIFPGQDMDYCQAFLEELRLTVQSYRMTLRDSVHRPKSSAAGEERRGRRAKRRKETTVSVTISIGMAEVDDRHVRPEEVLKAADKALYRAKKKGRNCLSR